MRHLISQIVLHHCSQWLSTAWQLLRLTQELPKALHPSLRMEQSLDEQLHATSFLTDLDTT